MRSGLLLLKRRRPSPMECTLWPIETSATKVSLSQVTAVDARLNECHLLGGIRPNKVPRFFMAAF